MMAWHELRHDKLVFDLYMVSLPSRNRVKRAEKRYTSKSKK